LSLKYPPVARPMILPTWTPFCKPDCHGALISQVPSGSWVPYSVMLDVFPGYMSSLGTGLPPRPSPMSKLTYFVGIKAA
jgi:hypothetical protein